MAEYINRENLDFLNDFCIDSGKYAGLRLDEVFDELATEDAIERSKIDKAIEEIEQLKHKNTDIEGYRWWNNAIENVLHILKEI